MSKEQALLLPLLEDYSEVKVNGFTLHIGKIKNHEVAVMQSGIGKVNAAIGVLTLIDTFHPSLVINSGVAGGTGGASVLDVVVASSVAYHDVWCGPGNEWGTVEGLPRFFTPAPLKVEGEGVKHGLIASGDIFVQRVEDLARIKELYPQVMACDMESGAVAQVCYIKGVPFAVIRVISDTPGGGDNFAQYVNFWDDAPERCFEIIKTLLESL